MPNTPCLIGQAASAYCCGSHATADDNETVFALLSSVGECTHNESSLIVQPVCNMSSELYGQPV